MGTMAAFDRNEAVERALDLAIRSGAKSSRGEKRGGFIFGVALHFSKSHMRYRAPNQRARMQVSPLVFRHLDVATMVTTDRKRDLREAGGDPQKVFSVWLTSARAHRFTVHFFFCAPATPVCDAVFPCPPGCARPSAQCPARDGRSSEREARYTK